MYALAVSRIADLTLGTRCCAWVVLTDTLAAADLAEFALSSAWKRLAFAKQTALAFGTVDVRAAAYAFALKAVLVVTWAVNAGARIAYALVNNAELFFAAEFRKASTVIKLAGAIARTTCGARSTVCDRAGLNTFAGNTGCGIAFASGCAVHVEARID